LAELLDGAEIVYTSLSSAEPGLLRGVQNAIEGLTRRNRTGETPPTRIGDARWLVGEDRMTKDPAAISSLRRAVHLSAEAHVEAMRQVEAGMWEYQVEALIEYEFRRHGGDGPGYTSIIASGSNATILHYVDNRDQLEAGRHGLRAYPGPHRAARLR
jgi:Xaa-Pro aminopeptidase